MAAHDANLTVHLADHITPDPEPVLTALAEVPLPVTVRLGSARLTLRELLELQQGSVVLLDRAIGEPTEVLVGDHVIALGELVRVNNDLGIRITAVSPAER